MASEPPYGDLKPEEVERRLLLEQLRMERILAAGRGVQVPTWLKAVHGFTLAGVITGIFAAGVWKGQIDAKIEQVLEGQKELKAEARESSNKLAYIEGLLQGRGSSLTLPRKTKDPKPCLTLDKDGNTVPCADIQR